MDDLQIKQKHISYFTRAGRLAYHYNIIKMRHRKTTSFGDYYSLRHTLTHANTPTQNAYHSANTHTDIQSAYLDTLAHANAHTKCISRYV